MRVRQHVYMYLKSEALDPDEISGVVGAEPDEVKLRGSRSQGPPPIPRHHIWRLNSGRSDNADLEEHFAALWPKLIAMAPGLTRLLARTHSRSIPHVAARRTLYLAGHTQAGEAGSGLWSQARGKVRLAWNRCPI